MTGNVAVAGAKPAVFVFCRPYLVSDFRSNLAPLSGEYDFHFLTDGKCAGTDDTRTDFYRLLKSGHHHTALSVDEIEDIRDRCRLLRNLPRARAEAMIHAMAGVLAAALDRIRPSIVITHIVDEYILHTLYVLAGHRGIACAGYCGSYFSGRALVLKSSLGEPHDVRRPPDDEVDATLQTISVPAFRQQYRHKSGYSRARHVKLVARYYAKRLAYRAKAIIENDPLNMHYLIGPYCADRKRLGDYPGDQKFDVWPEKIEALRASGRGPVVYVPLGYYPESTTNYWVRNRKMLDYDGMVVAMAENLTRAGMAVVVKEHVHMLGMRAPGLYAALRALNGVVLVQPEENSNIVLAQCDVLLIGAGSGGVEATLRDKPVVDYCETSYWHRPSRSTLIDLDAPDQWPQTIVQAIAAFKPMSDDGKREFIRECLCGTMRTRPGGKIWPQLDVDDMRQLLGELCGGRVKLEPTE